MKKRFLNVLVVLLFILLIVPLSVEAQENEAFKKEHFIKNSDTLNYRILFPKDFSEEKQYPDY